MATVRFDVPTLRDAQPRRICILKPSALGDVVQSLPVLDGLRARWPEASLSWVIRADLADLIDRHPLIDECLLFERRGGAGAFGRLLRRLRSRRFDLVIDLQGLLRTAMMALASGAPLRVGLEASREGAVWAHNIVLPDTGRDVPACARYARLAEVIGAPAAVSPRRNWLEEAPRLSTSIPAPERTTAKNTTSTGNAEATLLFAVHPGALWGTKRWPVGRFAAVAGRAVRAWGARIVVIGGADEMARSRWFVSSLRASVPAANVHDLTGRTSIAELAGVLQQADLLLTNDSGPMHLAAAVGTPVVGVFTATSPVLSGPPTDPRTDGPVHQLVSSPTPCAACYRRVCPLSGRKKNACQRDLTVECVWQAVKSAVRENSLRPVSPDRSDAAPLPTTPLVESAPVARRAA